MNLWLFVGAGALLIFLIMVVINLMLLRPESIGKTDSPVEPETSPAVQAGRNKQELAILAELLDEIEQGKGQEQVSGEEVDFANVHSSLLVRKPAFHEDPSQNTDLHQGLAGLHVPEEVGQAFSEMTAHPQTIGWIIYRGPELLRSSTVFDKDTAELFRSWSSLIEQTERVLALSSLHQLALDGEEGQVIVNRAGDYLLVSLRASQ